ncbi:hypothetical protein CVT24_003913 [Panaeolus cyanescens]|uniref:Phosphatidylinositol-specific phospholipase C X domain-containing protein n=1 Tax=Panaeolus cyanescens TaxID=181874 RepID=A0A409VVC2_9AGAR|nr:hypothetical protein CVT24_003913 [Panaeolus cyanescens]
MAPDLSKRWMMNHRKVFGDRPISELCLPGSHNAGSFRRGYHTVYGTEHNVVSQTRPIFDQLELGVRCLDIRPCLTSPKPNAPPGNWACGNFTGPAVDKVQWQGANGIELHDAIDDINRFTQDNIEVVFVEITRVYRVFIGKSTAPSGREPNQDEWNSLISLLSTIKNLFTVQRAGEKPTSLYNYTLNRFIGSGKAAVVVLVSDYPGDPDDLYKHGLWPSSTQGVQTLSLKGTLLTQEANWPETVSFFAPGWSSDVDSVLSLAKDLQSKRFPWLLQAFAASGYPFVIWMDRIQNVDLLTFCIATTYQRFNRSMGLQNMVIVYGGFLVTSPQVHQKVRQAIDRGNNFQVTNDNLGCDPWPNMDKSCAIFYEQNEIVKGRFERESQSFSFGKDIVSIEYGNLQIRDQDVYLHILQAMSNREEFIVTDWILRGHPQPGVGKTCVVRFRHSGNDGIAEVKAEEGGTLNFAF